MPRVPFAFILVAWFLSGHSKAAERLSMDSITLLQPEQVIEERVPDIEAFARYTKQVESAVRTHLEHNEDKTPAAGFIVMAVRPGGQTRVWLDLEPERSDEAEIVSAAQAVKGYPVRFGTVIHAVKVSVDGAPQRPGQLPNPDSWRAAMKSDAEPVEIGELVDRLWPNDAPSIPEDLSIEWVKEVLVPLDGTIERPKDWFFRTMHSDHSLVWTFSKEDSADGKRYETGVRIQLVSKIRERSGDTVEAAFRQFLEQHRRTASEFTDCGESEQGRFIRLCAESVEGPHRIMYSMFWDKDGQDIGVVMVAGTPVGEWERYRKAFDRMRAFTLTEGNLDVLGQSPQDAPDAGQLP